MGQNIKKILGFLIEKKAAYLSTDIPLETCEPERKCLNKVVSIGIRQQTWTLF